MEEKKSSLPNKSHCAEETLVVPAKQPLEFPPSGACIIYRLDDEVYVLTAKVKVNQTTSIVYCTRVLKKPPDCSDLNKPLVHPELGCLFANSANQERRVVPGLAYLYQEIRELRRLKAQELRTKKEFCNEGRHTLDEYDNHLSVDIPETVYAFVEINKSNKPWVWLNASNIDEDIVQSFNGSNSELLSILRNMVKERVKKDMDTVEWLLK